MRPVMFSRNLSSGELGSGELGFSELGSGELGSRELGSRALGSRELGPSERGSALLGRAAGRAARRLALLAGVALVGASGAPLPRAASASESELASIERDMQEAQRAFQSARQLEASGQLVEACVRFAESQRRYSSAVTLLNLGNCYENGSAPGGLLAAVRAFEQALVEASAISEPLLRERVRDEAQRRLGSARERLPSLVLQRSPTVGARVLLDGREVERFGVALPMNPGTHHLEVSAPGKLGQVRSFVLVERRELEIALPELLDPPGMPVGASGSPRRALPGAPAPVLPSSPAPSALPPSALPSHELPPHEATPPNAALGARRFGDLPFWLGGASAVFGAAWLFTGLTSRARDGEFRELRIRCALECDERARRDMADARADSHFYAQVTDFIIIPAFSLTLGTGLVLWWLDDFATTDAPVRQSALSDALRGTRAECSRDGCRWIYSGAF